MLTPGALALIPVSAAQAGDAVAAAPAVPPEAIDAISAWLAGQSPGDVPRSASGLLDQLRGGIPLPPGTPIQGWDAYFAALGTLPTSEERVALRDFQAQHPHVAREVEALALALARAHLLRDEAFSALTDAQWDLLPQAASLLAAGQPLDATHQAALAAVDMAKLLDAAAILARAGEEAPAQLTRAQALDEALDAAIPAVLRDPDADPASLMRAAARDATPVVTDLTLEDALRGIALLSGTPAEGLASARLLPVDLQAPLAAILVAHSRELASEGSGLATIATMADQLPALTRAAYNLSIASAGVQAAALGQPRPIQSLSVRGLAQPLRVIQEVYGAGLDVPAPRASFVEGYARLAAATGAPATFAQLAQARAAQDALGPDFSAALGSILAAQADYQLATHPDAALLDLRARALSIASSGGPLTLDQIDTLQRSATAEDELRDEVGRATFALGRATLGLPAVGLPTMQASAAQDIVFDQSGVLIMNERGSDLDEETFSEPRILIIDLGGDDTYRIPAATVGGSEGGSGARASILVDLGGNDRYETLRAIGPAAAVGTPQSPAFALLLDANGDDTYVGQSGGGYGVDALAFLVDVRGNDRYQFSGAALAQARSSSLTSVAAGALFDIFGNDTYVSGVGPVRLGAGSAAPGTVAALLDVTGADDYSAIPCPLNWDEPCFGVPRPENQSRREPGVLVFIDAHGLNKYPRNDTNPFTYDDPHTTGGTTGRTVLDANSRINEFGRISCQDVTNCEFGDPPVPSPSTSPGRFAYVSDTKELIEDENLFLFWLGLGSFPISPVLLQDSDGDIIPDNVENTAGTDPKDPTDPMAGEQDSDGDGFADILEQVLGTGRDDPGSYPLGVPRLPEPLPDPGLSPPNPANVVLNVPGVVVVGGPGPNRYADYYTLSIDLGLGAAEPDGDTYVNLTAVNGHALDLGGNDEYRPPKYGEHVAPALASVVPLGLGRDGALNSNVRMAGDAASLVDLGGNDRYVAYRDSLAHVSAHPDGDKRDSVAFFLDAGGDDLYNATGGRSQGYATDGGSAYFLDLRGDDRHIAPTQGVSERHGAGAIVTTGEPSVRFGRAALFLDGGGKDVYDAGDMPVAAESRDRYQGRVLGEAFLVSGAAANEAPAALFMDLGDDDRYLVIDATSLTRVDLAPQKEDRLRLEPVDGNGEVNQIQVFLDTTVFGRSGVPDIGPQDIVGGGTPDPNNVDALVDEFSPRDRDGDGVPDVVETIAGTNPRDATSVPAGVSGATYLNLPRVGVVVGGSVPNAYPAALEWALQVDVGAADTYRNRVGATSERFPVALAVDAAGSDEYVFDGATNLSKINGGRASRQAPPGIPDVYGGAQGSGIYGVGVLVDGAGSDRFSIATGVVHPCSSCLAVSAAAGQGAGVVGVGVLVLGGDEGDTFFAEAGAVAREGAARAATLSQGAGMYGVGILASTGVGADTYELRAHATSDASVLNLTTGQGYGFYNGTGILLDGGGNNEFIAHNLAQGVAGSFPASAPPQLGAASPSAYYPGGYPGGVPQLFCCWFHLPTTSDPERTIGALLLPGVGNDKLTASWGAQAFASGQSTRAVLLDAEGNDKRVVSDGLAQSAAIRGGLSLLVDNRGNDEYVAGGSAVQGFAFAGVAALADLSGADTYRARDLAQGAVANALEVNEFTLGVFTDDCCTPPPPDTTNVVRSSPPSLAFLVDRMGNDGYDVPEGAHAQGSGLYTRKLEDVRASTSTQRGVGLDRHAGVGFFVDAGGLDFYAAPPREQKALAKQTGAPTPTSRPENGNDWAWEASEIDAADAPNANDVTGRTPYMGYGIDNASITDTVSALTMAVGTNAATHQLSASCTAVCAGLIPLEASLQGKGTMPSNPQIDRVEFFDEAFLIGLGVPVNGAYAIDFPSDEPNPDGTPRHPDGHRDLYAYIYLRAGTPDASGRRVAVDAEPLTARQSIDLDNPPIPRAPRIDAGVTSAYGPLQVDLRVDRDLERCETAPCTFRLGHLTPAPDEWAQPAMQPPGTPQPDTACNSAACKPATITVASGGGKAYLAWTATPGVIPIGYLVARQTGSNAEVIGYVDARAGPNAWPQTANPVYTFVDPAPGAATAYEIRTVHGSAGNLLYTTKSATHAAAPAAPGPARGLRALGVEDAVHLEWLPADGATGYNVYRKAAGASEVKLTATPLGAAAVSYDDATADLDVEYTYRVAALKGSTETSVWSLPTRGKASPGHSVTMALQTGLAADTIVGAPILDRASFGGAQTHTFTWDASQVPDGIYWLNATFTDGSGRPFPHGTSYMLSPIAIDGTAPDTSIGLGGNVGGPLLTSSGLRIPFTVRDTGSGVKQTAIWVKVDNDPWPASPILASAGAKDVVFPGVRDGAKLRVIAVSEDNVSNVEGIAPGARAWTPTLQDGFEAALARGDFSTHTVDITPPQAKATTALFTVRPGQSIEFAVDVTDVGGTGVARVVADLRGEAVPLTPVGNGRYLGTWNAHGTDGLIQILITGTDAAGNTATLSAGAVVVDGTAPAIDAAQVSFPGGRVVGRPGETATLRVSAQDLFVNEGELNATVDTGNVSSTGETVLRYDADARVYAASFPVNRMAAKEANVTVRLLDGAGNLAVRNVLVHVNNTATSIGVPIAIVAPDAALVNFTTPDAARGRVDYGLSPQLGQSTEPGPVGKTHAIRVTGLLPDTEYYAIAIAITDSGIETRSDLISFRTAPSFNVTVDGVLGVPFSRGDAKVDVRLLRHDGVLPSADLEAYLLAPRGSPRIVGTALRVGAVGTLDLELASVRDGDYALVVKAREGELKGESAPRSLVIDRAAPLLSPPEALSAAKGAVYTLHVEERGSGIDLPNVSWTFGGRRCSALLANDTLSCVVPNLGADVADVEMLVAIPDRAGNLARLELRLPVDSSAPVVSGHALGAADGSAHLRAGAKGRISVDVQDLSVKSVEADLSRFGGSKAAPLDSIPGTTRYETVFEVPEDFPEGPLTILVRALDAGGQLTAIAVTSSVDATPPSLVSGSLVPQGPGEVMVALQLNEPAQVAVKAAGPLGDVQVESAEAAATQVVTLKGLRPGAPLRASVKIVDQAGHETTIVLDGRSLSDTKPPTKVAALRAEDRGDGRILLRWDAATDDDAVAHYRIIRTIAGQAPVTLPTVTGLLATDDVPVGATVAYTVAAVDHGGNAGEVATAEVTSVAVPRLEGGRVDPPISGPGVFTYAVNLTDAGGAAPEVVVRVDGVAHPMKADKADCREGCVFTATVVVGAETLRGGPHEYAFEVVSGPFRVAYPELDTLSGPTVLQGEAPPLSGVLAAANRVPAGGFIVAALALAAAVATVVLLRRRKA